MTKKLFIFTATITAKLARRYENEYFGLKWLWHIPWLFFRGISSVLWPLTVRKIFKEHKVWIASSSGQSK